MKLIFASHNEHKVGELKLLLPAEIALISLSDLNFREEIAETGSTLYENALIKARSIYGRYQADCFADDSGLEVEALNGEPGVYSARYAGPQKIDADNNGKLLSALKDETNRKACFKTVIALILGGKEYTFEGVIKGTIMDGMCGINGFGYDPLFKPEGYELSFAEMSDAEKSRISHRARAVNKLVDFLSQGMK